MNKTSPQDKPAPNWIRIVARIWSVPIILVVTFFVVGTIWTSLTNGSPDPYAVGETTLVEQVPPILIAISTLGLALAWRWEKIGGIVSLLFISAMLITHLVQSVMTREFSRILIPSLLGIIVLIPGVLFLISGIRATRNHSS